MEGGWGAEYMCSVLLQRALLLIFLLSAYESAQLATLLLIYSKGQLIPSRHFAKYQDISPCVFSVWLKGSWKH